MDFAFYKDGHFHVWKKIFTDSGKKYRQDFEPLCLVLGMVYIMNFVVVNNINYECNKLYIL